MCILLILLNYQLFYMNLKGSFIQNFYRYATCMVLKRTLFTILADHCQHNLMKCPICKSLKQSLLRMDSTNVWSDAYATSASEQISESNLNRDYRQKKNNPTLTPVSIIYNYLNHLDLFESLSEKTLLHKVHTSNSS